MPGGASRGSARGCDYHFVCAGCNQDKPKGTVSVGVKPRADSLSHQWKRFCHPLCIAAFDKQASDEQMVDTRSSSSSNSISSRTIDPAEELALAAALGPQGVNEKLAKDTNQNDAKYAEKELAMKECLAGLGLEVVSEISSGCHPKRLIVLIHTCPLSQVKVPGDGDCFYHVLIRWLNLRRRVNITVDKLRSDIADFMEKERQTFEPLMVDDTTFEDFTMGARGSAWADDVVMMAAARKFNVRLRIISPRKVPTVIEPPAGATETIDIAHDPGVHFDGAQKIEPPKTHQGNQGTSKKPGKGKSGVKSANVYDIFQVDDEDAESDAENAESDAENAEDFDAENAEDEEGVEGAEDVKGVEDENHDDDDDADDNDDDDDDDEKKKDWSAGPAGGLGRGANDTAAGDDDTDSSESGDDDDDDYAIGDSFMSAADQNKSLFDAAKTYVSSAPRLQPDGSFVRPGSGPKSSRKMSLKEVNEWRDKHPIRRGNVVEDAALRARNLRPRAGWDADSRNEAMQAFATNDVKFTSFLHELNERDALIEEERFQVVNDKKEVTGVLQCCDVCLTNGFVIPQDAFSTSDVSQVRTLHGPESHEVRVGTKYCCRNPRCPAVQFKAGFAEAKGKSGELPMPLKNLLTPNDVEQKHVSHWFCSWLPSVVATLPKRLQLKLNGGGVLNKGGYSASMNAALLETDDKWQELTRKTRRAYAAKAHARAVSYVNFCTDEDTRDAERAAVAASEVAWQQRWQGFRKKAADSRTASTLRSYSQVPAVAEQPEHAGASAAHGEPAQEAPSSFSIAPPLGPVAPSIAPPSDQASLPKQGAWPALLPPERGGPLSAPTKRNITSYFSHAFAAVRDFLIADLLSQVPGNHLPVLTVCLAWCALRS